MYEFSNIHIPYFEFRIGCRPLADEVPTGFSAQQDFFVLRTLLMDTNKHSGESRIF